MWRRRKAFIDTISRNNPHAGKLHVYTRTATPGSCVRDNGPHLYVHAKMAVIDDEVMLIGSTNCNNRRWETDSELVVAALRDPLRPRGLWDTASTRQVCAYDPVAGKDKLGSDRPDRLTDPSDRRPGDPCVTLLSS